MKKIVIAAVVLSMCTVLAACGKGNVITGYKKGDLELGQYKGLTYTPMQINVTDEEIEEKIQSDLKNDRYLSEIEGKKTVETGDVVSIDYECIVDGVPFERGKGSKDDLVVGSDANTFFEGLDDALIGKELGQFDVDITFPDTYYLYPELSSKTATFKINLKSINEYAYPELTDEWVSKYTDGESTTVAAYREKIKNELTEKQESSAESDMRYQILRQVFANTKFKVDLSKEVFDYCTNLKATQDVMASQYGVSTPLFFEYQYGLSEAYYDDFMEAQSKIIIQFNYIRSAIVEAENIQATDEEAEALAETARESYGCSTNEEFYKYILDNFKADGKTYLREQVKLNKATDILFDTAVAK